MPIKDPGNPGMSNISSHPYDSTKYELTFRWYRNFKTSEKYLYF